MQSPETEENETSVYHNKIKKLAQEMAMIANATITQGVAGDADRQFAQVLSDCGNELVRFREFLINAAEEITRMCSEFSAQSSNSLQSDEQDVLSMPASPSPVNDMSYKSATVSVEKNSHSRVRESVPSSHNSAMASSPSTNATPSSPSHSGTGSVAPHTATKAVTSTSATTYLPSHSCTSSVASNRATKAVYINKCLCFKHFKHRSPLCSYTSAQCNRRHTKTNIYLQTMQRAVSKES